MTTEAEPAYTIDELAAHTGVPSRTIRFYQSKGALPAPRREGRVAVYGPEHVERLQTIAELQDRGLRLDAIRDVLKQMESGGDSLQAWLGIGERLQAPWLEEQPLVLTRDELAGRIGARAPGLISRLEKVGTVRRTGDSLPPTFVVQSPGLLDIIIELERAGVDIETASGAGDILRRRLTKAAKELVEHFSKRIGEGFGRGGDIDDVVESFEAFRLLGATAVQIIFAQEMERALRRFVESGKPIPPSRS